jgi:cell division initiation protein
VGEGAGSGAKDAPGTLRPGTLTALLQEIAEAPASALGSDWGLDLRPGAVVGRFELVRELGRGGFGVVWEAKDRELGRSVALKAVRTGGRTAVREERLLREAEAAARLSHPNLVTLFDVGRAEQGPYLVLELLRGETLEQRLSKGPEGAAAALRMSEANATRPFSMTERGYEPPGSPPPATPAPLQGGANVEEPHAFLDRLEEMARAGVRFLGAVDAAALDALAAGAARGGGARDLAIGEGLLLLARSGGDVRLGYSGVGDLARERLGLAADQARRLRRDAERLRSRPPLREAVLRGEVTLRKAEVVLREAVGAEEAYWVARAKVDTVRRLEAAVRSGAEYAEADWHRLRIGLPPEEAKIVEVALEVAGILTGPTAPLWQRIAAIAMEFLSGHPIEPMKGFAPRPPPSPLAAWGVLPAPGPPPDVACGPRQPAAALLPGCSPGRPGLKGGMWVEVGGRNGQAPARRYHGSPERPMNITPLDITQKVFHRVFRGLDPEEVEAFLGLVAVEFEALVKEVLALREDNQRKAEDLAEFKSRERALHETLVTAQRASEEIRESARKEAEITLADAELQAEKIVQAAHGRFLRIVDDINELKRQRLQFETNVRTLVESHVKLLDAFREPSREEAVQFMPRKKAIEE